MKRSAVLAQPLAARHTMLFAMQAVLRGMLKL